MKEFNAEILEITNLDNRHGVVLDHTAFYPSGGGQPADKGVIKGEHGEIHVVGVRMKKDTVVHFAEEIIGQLAEGDSVKGVIDWTRRYALMRIHTAAHLISEAVRKVVDRPLAIVGSGIDVDRARLDLAYHSSLGPLLLEIENVANAVVEENRPVEIKIMPRREAENYVTQFHESLKILPPQVQKVRIVEIKDWHACACGGIHVKATGEIGAINVLRRMSKGKDVERIEFTTKTS
ncbi:MAG: alanyl-tRNA editing protein [Candidatus Bathyarchaeota archaeon]